MKRPQIILLIGLLSIYYGCGNKSNRTEDPITPESGRFSLEKLNSRDLAKNIDPTVHYIYTVHGSTNIDIMASEQSINCQAIEWQEDVTLSDAFYERYRTTTQMRLTTFADGVQSECQNNQGLTSIPSISKMTNLTVLRKYYQDSKDFFKDEKKICEMLKVQANINCTKINKFDLAPIAISIPGRSTYAIQLQFEFDGTLETEDEDGKAKLGEVQIIGNSISNSFAPYDNRPFKLYLKIKQKDIGVEVVITDSQLVAIEKSQPHHNTQTSLSFAASEEQLSENQKLLNDLTFYLYPNPGQKPLALTVTSDDREVVGLEISEVLSIHKKIMAGEPATECLFSEQYDYLSKVKDTEEETYVQDVPSAGVEQERSPALLVHPAKLVLSPLSSLKSACVQATDDLRTAHLKNDERPLFFTFDRKTKKGQLGPLQFQVMN